MEKVNSKLKEVLDFLRWTNGSPSEQDFINIALCFTHVAKAYAKTPRKVLYRHSSTQTSEEALWKDSKPAKRPIAHSYKLEEQPFRGVTEKKLVHWHNTVAGLVVHCLSRDNATMQFCLSLIQHYLRSILAGQDFGLIPALGDSMLEESLLPFTVKLAKFALAKDLRKQFSGHIFLSSSAQTQSQICYQLIGSDAKFYVWLIGRLEESVEGAEERKKVAEMNFYKYTSFKQRSKTTFRHAYTQIPLGPGQKIPKSSSSPQFPFCCFYPKSRSLTFPLLSAATQTETDIILKIPRIKMRASSRKSNTVRIPPIIVEAIKIWGDKLEAILPDQRPILVEPLEIFKFYIFCHQNRSWDRVTCKEHAEDNKVAQDCSRCSPAALVPPPWRENLSKFFEEEFSERKPKVKPMFGNLLSVSFDTNHPTVLGKQMALHFLRWFYLVLNQEKQSVGCDCALVEHPEVLGIAPRPAHLSWEEANVEMAKAKSQEEKMGILEKLLGHKKHKHSCSYGKCDSVERGGMVHACSGCKKLKLVAKCHYCSSDCANLHWPEHKKLHDAFGISHFPVA